ncbi:Protein of unknown function [Pyronema omphalodes CBS 100304]|uniref:Uncharacterized protein n=1 Tax=Pyronema omphalodes (strain CBS 100304) TaxID=1076935 RepID=U4L711_PYROM|nr:Protein of unknown function [Pyronema omphalodes CBS 100304]
MPSFTPINVPSLKRQRVDSSTPRLPKAPPLQRSNTLAPIREASIKPNRLPSIRDLLRTLNIDSLSATPPRSTEPKHHNPAGHYFSPHHPHHPQPTAALSPSSTPIGLPAKTRAQVTAHIVATEAPAAPKCPKRGTATALGTKIVKLPAVRNQPIRCPSHQVHRVDPRAARQYRYPPSDKAATAKTTYILMSENPVLKSSHSRKRISGGLSKPKPAIREWCVERTIPFERRDMGRRHSVVYGAEVAMKGMARGATQVRIQRAERREAERQAVEMLTSMKHRRGKAWCVGGEVLERRWREKWMK